MPGIKKILFLLLALLLVFVIASCGDKTKVCAGCIDIDSDDICDVCKKAMPEDIVSDVPLFEDGEPSFQIVLAKNTSSAVKQAINSTLNATVEDCYGVTITSFTEESDNDKEIDVEILIGNVTARGEECFFDGHSLGKEGYVIKIIGSKIIINGGADKSLVNAIEKFAEFLATREDFDEVVITKADTVLVIQDNYKVDSLKVNGNDMKGYTFAVDITRKYYKDAAVAIQDTIYDKTGYWFNIVDIENATDQSLILKHSDGVTGEESFKVYADGTQLVIECGFDNMLEDAALQFTTLKISTASGNIDFKGTVFTRDISIVYYDDFGAKGDGITDDFFAIREAHIFANECGQTVKASRNPNGKVYYIYDTLSDKTDAQSVVSIPIRTSTDWQNVKFIIDDEKIPTFRVTKDTDPTINEPGYDAFEHEKHYRMGRGHIFEILPDAEHEGFKFTEKSVLDQIVADGLNPNTTCIDFKIDGWEGDLMLIPCNVNHKVFRRLGNYGNLQSLGQNMQEIIVIDKNGNVSPETPIMFEYTSLDHILVYKLDPSAEIKVGNAEIVTIDPRVKNERYDLKTGKNLFSTAYVNRGINVSRSYTVIENVKHELLGGYTLKERANGFESSNYTGMFQADNANHVTFRNCYIHGRQQYEGHSSYDLKANFVNKIVFENCIQPNFWITVDPEVGIMNEHSDYVQGAYPSSSEVEIYDDNGKLQKLGMCWSIAGTNYCKNLEYINCQLSHFDAHIGLYNGKIINTKTNRVSIAGYGTLEMKNVTWYQREPDQPIFLLRDDYGCFWDGDVIMEDVKAYVFDITDKKTSLRITFHEYTNFYYGYLTAFPNITINNLDVYSMKNQAPVEAGYEINLFRFKDNAKKMHLKGEVDSNLILPYADLDKDGYIDEPLFDSNFDGYVNELDKIDLDGNGKIGNTTLKYKDYADLDEKEQNKGIMHPSCKRNVNTVKPPEFIKIINNDGVNGSGGYVYKIVNTAGISDGGWYRDKDAPDTMGGFFGATKFIYGTGENDCFIGTNHIDQTKTATFKFISSYYK